jgi:purine-binding chemotaxis protein CheW
MANREMGQYLTFKIAGETCAVAIRNVESVLENGDLSLVPGSPDYVGGLLNLRGEAVPVVDVRRKLGLGKAEGGRDASIIVLAFDEGGKKRLVGALVDAVCEVIELADSSVDPIGDFAVAFDRNVVSGIGRRESGFVVMIAADRLFERSQAEAPTGTAR